MKNSREYNSTCNICTYKVYRGYREIYTYKYK